MDGISMTDLISDQYGRDYNLNRKQQEIRENNEARSQTKHVQHLKKLSIQKYVNRQLKIK
jgi:hypothetical protein